MTRIRQTYISILLALGALEFFIATSLIFSFEPDPKNALLLGFSAARWAVILTTISCGITSLYLARRIHQRGLSSGMEYFLTRNFLFLRSASIVLFLVGVIIILSPPDHLGKYAGQFERVRPLLIVLTILPVQFFIPTIFKADSKQNKDVLKHSLTALSILLIFAGFIALTRLGVDPDTLFWNVAGVPLTTLQLTIVFLIMLLSFHAVNKVSTSAKLSPIAIDICIAFLIYIVGVAIWSQTPMLKHFNALRPAPPAFQYFPFSDARIHDLGARSIVDGYGIYFGEYTDKPFYMVLLSIFHGAAGNDYNMLGMLHLYSMGLVLPCLFWFGKQLHSRHLGIAIALIILIRQRNAILLAHILAGTNPRLLLTEIPTMLGLIVLCIFVFSWIKEGQSNESGWSYPLLAGGVLGTLSLIRLNPVGLFPILLFVGAIALRKFRTNWFRQIVIFMLGFFVILMPWMLTGRDANGYPYFLVKFIDVINVRYFSGRTPSIEKNNGAYVLATRQVAPPASFHLVKTHRLIDVQSFPGFVINHFLHNAVASVLALPDSFSKDDQVLQNLMQRPYMDEKQRSTWRGELQAVQIPFIGINLFLLALGSCWSWDRWKWAGVFPGLIFVGYILTLGFARSSGSRYIVPVDWILFLYYAIGIIILLEKFTNIFENIQAGVPTNASNNRIKSIPTVFALATIVLLSALIPIAQIPIISRNLPLCENQISDPVHPGLNLLKGRVLYPYLDNKTFSFVFLTCDQSIEIAIPDSDVPLQNEQTIIIGFSKTELNRPGGIFLEEGSVLQQVWVNE